MAVLFIKFAIGLSLLLFSTEKFVRLAERIAKVLKISPLIVGITIVAIGTSIPELVVSVISMFKQDTNLAMGNIIGSNIVNVLLILPVGILIGAMKIGRIKTQQSALFLLGSTAIFLFVHFVQVSHVISGAVLIGLAVAFSIMEYHLGVEGRDHEDVKQHTKNQKIGAITLAQVIIGIFLLLLIIVGGILIVESVEAISLFTGLSTSILGLTLTAVATSLPELLTTIYSQNNNQEKITIGNILGSNIYNLMLIGGILMLFPIQTFISQKELIWLGATTIGFVAFLRFYSGRSPSKLVGILLLLILFLYLRFQ